ncbi:MAG: hypothetical protein JNG90_19500 [Planctomycetaceae bacterium]|nr:hypothetical protein [Planctomycetaceae bacterium]
MGVATEYVLHNIRLPTGEDLTQLTEHSNNPSVEQMTAMSAGNPHPQFAAVQAVKPEVSFSTTQLKTLLDKTGGTSGCATAALSSGNTDLYYRRVENLGLRTAVATTAHRRFRGTSAMLVINQLQAEHRGIATADAMIVFQFDGTNPPLVPAGTLALVGTPLAAQQFTLGPVFLNGTQLPSVQRTQWQPNPQLFRDSAESEVYDSYIAADSVDSLFTFATLEVGVWDTLGINGLALSGAGLEVYLRKKNANGIHVPNATAEHIKLTGALGQAVLGPSTGGRKVAHELRVQVVQPADGSSPLVVSTASTIPAGT